MNDIPAKGSLINCAFCGRNQYQVRRIVKGPTADICCDCVIECVRAIMDHADIIQPKTFVADRQQ